MTSNGLSFHHPIVFWLGCIALTGGVLAHFPSFLASSHQHYHMAGMPMDDAMMIGMVLIPLGFLAATYGLMPRISQLRRNLHGDSIQFHVADSVPLNHAHWLLVVVLLVALAVDVMKPATLGFVMPGMSKEYEISKQTAGWLPLVALTGTTIGSIVWGRIADSFGRRAAILLSALMFIGTAICGAMNAFALNLLMCFMMGASAGGLLPITFTLMAEMIPARHRGWLLVALGGLGTSAGYLIAAGSAALLEPLFSWRVLWLLGLPTGALIIVLDRWIPESPRFLANAGLMAEAREVLAKFCGVIDREPASATQHAADDGAHAGGGIGPLLAGAHAAITWGLVVCGIAWGLVNFGFMLWLPTNLRAMGMADSAATLLLAQSALLALPGIGIVIWLYHRWSSIKALVLFATLTTGSLLVFCALGVFAVHAPIAFIVATVMLLVSASGVIAMLIPYAAEIYPVQLRATGAGIVAASSKFGGILGAIGGVAGVFNDLAYSALLIAAPMALSAILLGRRGVETRGRRLEDIQNDVSVRTRAPAAVD
jgi:putative MFS transporter